MDPVVQLRKVSVRYGNSNGGLTAVADVDLSVMPGEVVSIVGKSGCGKTTLLKVIAGLVRPVSGEVLFNNKGVNGYSKGVGMLFQSPLLLPWRTVIKNILLPIEIINGDLESYLSRAYELIEKTGLKGYENSYPWELSGGMQQRVALCRALIHKPPLLLLDEPFSALDAITREEMWNLLQEVITYEKCTTILVTHDVREAVLLSDRVVVMGGKPGRIKSELMINFRRPRDLMVQYTKEFNDYVVMIKNLIGD
ncbi:MAG: ABC transporter ATP-binding protein [Sulfolobales archaeon]|nr:ABC transporter ATP-binding protein [Sulfolobales archaeon]MCX8185991.1 ABC transporter ATP-binding protein [Sulfolobales archaeon]